MDEQKQHISVHLNQLRTCIVRSILAVFICMCICYGFSFHIMQILKKPMLDILPDNANFIVLAPYEYFFVELKAAIFFGVILACPIIFWQIWMFVAPGLYKNEQKLLFSFIFSASFCFVIGLLFAYFLVFPPTFKFFIETLPEGIVGQYSISMLYGFAITVLLAFGIVFQTPVAVYLLILLEMVSIETFKKARRYIFVGCFIVGALLTPPDPITQIMLAIPMYGLFELGLFLGQVFKKEKRIVGDSLE